MSDLISKSALIEDIETEIINLKMNGLKGTPRPCEELYQFIERIKEQPTVEAKPVVKGEWIDKGWDGDFSWKIDGRGNCWKVEECSICGHKLCGSAKTNFCPECGADMRGEKND